MWERASPKTINMEQQQCVQLNINISLSPFVRSQLNSCQLAAPSLRYLLVFEMCINF